MSDLHPVGGFAWFHTFCSHWSYYLKCLLSSPFVPLQLDSHYLNHESPSKISAPLRSRLQRAVRELLFICSSNTSFGTLIKLNPLFCDLECTYLSLSPASWLPKATETFLLLFWCPSGWNRVCYSIPIAEPHAVLSISTNFFSFSYFSFFP